MCVLFIVAFYGFSPMGFYGFNFFGEFYGFCGIWSGFYGFCSKETRCSIGFPIGVFNES